MLRIFGSLFNNKTIRRYHLLASNINELNTNNRDFICMARFQLISPLFFFHPELSLDKPLSYYRRELPPQLIDLSSTEGKSLFKESIKLGDAEAFYNLIGNFTTQTDPRYCGLGTLAMVLNALEVDPKQTWKGIWRWYSDEMLDCAPLQQIQNQGLSFYEFASLARCNGLEVIAKRADQITKEEWIKDLLLISKQSHVHMVVSFSRDSLGQTGLGHYSPIGAINRNNRKVLVLDVARFKYPSYWVSFDMLWDAMLPLDPTTNHSRGYYIISKALSPSCGLTSEAS